MTQFGFDGEFQSTHPLRGATVCGLMTDGTRKIFQSTHPLRGATRWRWRWPRGALFQSTHPLRGATRVTPQGVAIWPDFNPRTPCGVRHIALGYRPRMAGISIHAPLAGCDLRLSARSPTSANFNPRTPCGVRQRSQGGRVGGGDFNPRTPCGVRRWQAG